MSRYIKADALIERWNNMSVRGRTEFDQEIMTAPSIEPNLILPEQMGRGDIYEVGETIVVMNHDDYYDLLCKSWMPSIDIVRCQDCKHWVYNFNGCARNPCTERWYATDFCNYGEREGE